MPAKYSLAKQNVKEQAGTYNYKIKNKSKKKTKKNKNIIRQSNQILKWRDTIMCLKAEIKIE